MTMAQIAKSSDAKMSAGVVQFLVRRRDLRMKARIRLG